MGDNPEAKIFVGGLNHITTANSLRTYFSRYGEVVATNIVFDRMTQKSRGFGFCAIYGARSTAPDNVNATYNRW